MSELLRALRTSLSKKDKRLEDWSFVRESPVVDPKKIDEYKPLSSYDAVLPIKFTVDTLSITIKITD